MDNKLFKVSVKTKSGNSFGFYINGVSEADVVRAIVSEDHFLAELHGGSVQWIPVENIDTANIEEVKQ